MRSSCETAEARAQLLVCGEIAGLAEIDERLTPAADLVGDDDRPAELAFEELDGQRAAGLETLDRLSRRRLGD